MKSALGFEMRRLFFDPPSNTAFQAFRALVVGGIAFIGDAGTLYLFSLTGLHYLICSAISFIVGVAINFSLSIVFVFPNGARVGRSSEVSIFIAISLVGLVLTELIMWTFTEFVGFHFMLSKCVAAVIVFAWNFTARKLILYSSKDG